MLNDDEKILINQNKQLLKIKIKTLILSFYGNPIKKNHNIGTKK